MKRLDVAPPPTLDWTEAWDFVGHQNLVLVSAVDLHDLLPTLTAPGSGQGRDHLLAADLALKLLLFGVRTGGQRRGSRPPGLVERGVLVGALSWSWGGRQQGPGLMGAVVTLWSGRNRPEDLVSQCSLGPVQFSLHILDRDPLVLRPGPQVAVAVEVFGNRVLLVVAVQVGSLFGSVGGVHILQGNNTNLLNTQRFGSEPLPEWSEEEEGLFTAL